MKHLPCVIKSTASLLLGVCFAGALSAETLVSPAQSLPVSIAFNSADKTILLVSLEDGTVIKQLIDVDADICFKQNSSSSTICLTQGEPIIDAATNAVIGYEMIENHIDLVAKND